MDILKNKKGFTLIEVIVALAIIGIIAVGLLSLFTSGLVWIHSAGDKGVAYSEAQLDVESRLATEEAEETLSELVINFDGAEDVKVPGGVVGTYQEHQKRSSNLETFVPYVATINIEPPNRIEGEISSDSLKATINGTNTNFNSSTRVDIYDKTGTTVLYSDSELTVVVISNIELEITLPQYLVNSLSNYIIRVETTIDGEIEAARAKYSVTEPNYLVAGNQEVYTSANGGTWLERSNITISPLPSFTMINGSTFGGGRYVLVGNGGRILLSGNQKPWSSHTISGAPRLNGIIWSSYHHQYFVVSENGNVYKSDNGSNWQTINTSASKLNGISANSQQSGVVAVGENEEGEALIITSVDGSAWNSTYSFENTEKLNGILYYYDNVGSEYYIAVGNNGTLITSTDGTEWSEHAGVTDKDLRAVTFNGFRFAIVGDGVILTSTVDDLSSWTTVATEHDLYSIRGQSGEMGVFRAVGINRGSSPGDGIVLTTTNNFNTVTSITQNQELFTITARIGLE